MKAALPEPGPGYWLLLGLVLPAVNWWLALWTLVFARSLAPLLIVLPLVLAGESLALDLRWRRRLATSAPGWLGTAGLLLVTTAAWSCLLTFLAFAFQHGGFTF